jgi:hypothetical protein
VLRKESVSKSLWDVLRELQSLEIFNDYFLVGGTALALQLGHRISIDIDLFTRKDLDKDNIFAVLSQKYKKDFQIKNIQKIIVQISVREIKVDLVKYDYELIENIYNEESIRYLGKKDIAAMKLAAIANSGERAKDFVDVYYLLKEIPLNDMFEYYKIKYNQNDISHVKRSVIYFEDVPENSWETVNLLQDTLSVEKVKETIINEMYKYEKNKIIGNNL